MIEFDETKLKVAPKPTFEQAVIQGFHKWHPDNPFRGLDICSLCEYQESKTLKANKHHCCYECLILINGKHCGDDSHPFAKWSDAFDDKAVTKHADQIFEIFRKEMERIG